MCASVNYSKMWYGLYFDTWAARWSSDSTTHDLATIPSECNLVFLAFVQPSCSYVRGQNSFVGTGLQFSSDFSVVKGAIKILTTRGVTVLLSVGGATYPFDAKYNPKAIGELCRDLGASGVDIDWEPIAGIKGDGELGPIIAKTRALFPRPLYVTMAGFSVGCYGAMKWESALPASQNSGMNIKGITTNGSDLDFIGIMAYDAGPTYNALEAVAAYRQYYLGPLVVGIEVGQQAWGGAVFDMKELPDLVRTADGIFVWSYYKQGFPRARDVIDVASKLGVVEIPKPAKVEVVYDYASLEARLGTVEAQMDRIKKAFY